MSIYELTLNDFLKKASSDSPTPGGGNVSAVVGALGASMAAMVASLTKDKKGYEEHQVENSRILKELLIGIENFKKLTQDDMEAFSHYMACFKLPRETEEDKKIRSEKIQQAAQKATLAPLAVCQECLRLMQLSAQLAPFGNKGAISDCGVAAIVLESALRAAMLSVDINIPSIKDEKFVSDVISERGRLMAEAEELKIDILFHMRSRW